MNTNYEVLNYLNLTNGKLGKVYKLTGFNPLPEGFVLSEEIIKERLFLNQMQNKKDYPDFIFEEKKVIKKHFKISLKNIKKLEKTAFLKNSTTDFALKFETYLQLRKELTDLILQEFKKQDFDECEAFNELYLLNPIFGELLEGIFEENFNGELPFEVLEEKYLISYLEKVQIIEKQKKKKSQKNKINENILIADKNVEKSVQKNKEKTQMKNSEKIVKKSKKIKINSEIKEK